MSTYIVSWRFVLADRGHAVRNEAEDRACPQQHGEPAKQLLAKLDPFRRGFRRSQGVRSISFQLQLRYLMGKTLKNDKMNFEKKVAYTENQSRAQPTPSATARYPIK